MNASEQPSDHVHSRIAGWGCCIFSLVALLILVGQIVFSVVTLPLLPDIVPSHWDAAGQVNGTMDKGGFVLTFIGINIGLFLLFQVIKVVVKLADQSEAQLGTSIVSVVTLFPLVINLVIQVATTGAVLHW
jgi:uncharacterized membrane protein